MHTKHKIISVLLAALLLGSGCGKDREMTAFHDNMDTFYESLAITVNILESIDPTSDTAVEDMLSSLDSMNDLFQTLAALEVPEEFADKFGNIEELADEAAAYMQQADSLYHEAYQEEYDDSLGMAAGENYSRAMKRVNYIAILLQGRIPEDDNISVISEDEASETE